MAWFPHHYPTKKTQDNKSGPHKELCNSLLGPPEQITEMGKTVIILSLFWNPQVWHVTVCKALLFLKL